MRRLTSDEWQQRLNKIEQPLIIVGKHKQVKKEIFTLQCYKCGGLFETDRNAMSTAVIYREKGIKDSNWCPYCNEKRTNTGINDVATLRKDLIKYFANPEEAKNCGIGSHHRVVLKCPECGQLKNLCVSDLCSKGFHCDYCSDNVSLGNKIIRNLMLQLPVKTFDFEYMDSWTNNKRYDCYFEFQDNKYLIEIDGEQHIKDTSWSTKEWQKQNDLLKSKLAIENGFELIRLKAYRTDFDYIKQSILESKLSEIFDLGDIDWDAILRQTITSMNIEIANYYNEHEEMMIKDIAKHFHISPKTLTNTLKKMAQIGMCNYTKEKSFLNGRIQNGKNMIGKRKVG